MNKRKLLRRSVFRAASASGNLISGALSLAASATLWNPLPLILWGLGSTGWVVFASTSEKYRKLAVDEERSTLQATTQQNHDRLRETVESALALQPLRGWSRSGQLPDYMSQYRKLLALRGRVARILYERREIESLGEIDIEHQLSYLLSAYLEFVRARVAYLQILANLRFADEAPAERAARAEKAEVVPPFPRLEDRLAEIDRKIQDLTVLARKEPVAAETRTWHVGILQKQRELLTEFGKRDQLVSAQLSAFPDVFDMIFTRVSASEFKANEIVGYMGQIVEQVEETERFVEAIRPAMDAMLGKIDPIPLTH